MSSQVGWGRWRLTVDKRTQRFVLHFLRAYPRRTAAMVAALGFSALAEGVGLLSLLPVLELAIDPSGDVDAMSPLSAALARALTFLGLPVTLPVLLAMVVFSFSLKGVLYFVAMRQVGFSVAHVGHDLRLALLDALMHARWSHVEQQPIGQVANTISSETHRASWGYLSVCGAIAECLQIVVYLAIILSVAWQVAVLLPLAALVMFVGFGPLIALSRNAGNRSTAHLGDLVCRLAEQLAGMKAIKAMGLERESWPLMTREAVHFMKSQQHTVVAREALKAAYEPLVAVLLAVLFFAMLNLDNAGLATLLLIAALFQRLMTRASLLQGHYQSINANESAFFSACDQIDAARRHAEPPGGRLTPPRLEQALTLESVSFSHGDRIVLDHIDLVLPAGGLYVITGASGAGKSTLADIILALHTPDSGSVRVDGMPLSQMKVLEWRQQIGFLPQDPLLFHDSIRRNVALEDHTVTDTAIRHACELAGVIDVVNALPDGLDHVVGERGGRLSGGQRQRLCLARALVRRPRLLLLDEATSALDPATERQVCQNLASLRSTLTTVAISHQPAIMAVADRVLRLEHGKLRDVPH